MKVVTTRQVGNQILSFILQTRKREHDYNNIFDRGIQMNNYPCKEEYVYYGSIDVVALRIKKN
jgi:hypothetical protein